MTTKLKHCPFCGGAPKENVTDISPGYQTSSVRCTKCPALVGKCDLEADEAWNTRFHAPMTRFEIAMFWLTFALLIAVLWFGSGV